MPRSKHARILRHFTAMQLILSMQRLDGAESKYPNIQYVLDNDKDKRMIPPGKDPAKRFDINFGLTHMHDLLTLVDPLVYDAFFKVLSNPIVKDNVNLTSANLENSIHTSMSFLHHVTDQAETPMWEDPPHPCTYIMREIVADLLAD